MKSCTNELFYDKVFPSGREQRASALLSLFEAIAGEGVLLSLSDEELHLVVDEAVTNAMEHGNKWDPGKNIHITAGKDARFLHIVIEDEGTGFDYGNPESDFEKGNKLSHRGRGLSLIRRFCSPLWQHSGRCIDLPIRLS
ncbi:MAG: ATP-binding protein [Spirochaetota bacterium]